MFEINVWTIIFLILAAPVVLSMVGLVVLAIIKVIKNIYIHIRYGIKYTDQDE